jgi:peroxiredoxin
MKRIMVSMAIVSLLLTTLGIAVSCSIVKASSTPVAPAGNNQVAEATVPAGIKVDNLTLNPSEVNAGVQTLITVKVTNASSADTSYSGRVKISSLAGSTLPTYLFSPVITVPAGATQVTSVSTSIKNPGTYQVTWGDANKTLVVSGASNPQTGGQSFPVVTAPDFTGTDVVTGKAVSLQQFKGKAVVLNFVNYGCNPSTNNVVSAQLLAIKKTYEQRGDFIPVSVFCGCCPPDVLRQFAKDNGLNWPWILDSSNAIVSKYSTYLRQYGYPTLIFIDKNMLITDVTGSIDQTTLGQKLDAITAGGITQ